MLHQNDKGSRRGAGWRMRHCCTGFGWKHWGHGKKCCHGKKISKEDELKMLEAEEVVLKEELEEVQKAKEHLQSDK